MAGRKHRTLEELYKLAPKIAKPKVTPVLRGVYRIQGPVDEVELNIGTSKEALPVDKIILYEDIPLRTEFGISGACVAPCSSCTGSPCLTASDVELKTEDDMPDESGRKKVVKRTSFGSAEPHLVRGGLCDDQPQTSEMSNLVSACSSRDSFSENVDSRGIARMCDTSGLFLCDGSKLLTSEEQVDDNHDGGCSKSGLVLGTHTARDLVDGSHCHDSSSSALQAETHSTSTRDPGQEKNSTCESGGDSHKQGINRSLKRLLAVDSLKTGKDTQTKSKALGEGTNGKDQSISNAASDSNSAQSNITSHTFTGTASSECHDQVLNSDDNLSHLSESGDMKILPCDHNVDSRTCNGTNNFEGGSSVGKRSGSSMVSLTGVSKSSDGSDRMSLLCSSNNSSHVELLEVVDVPRKQTINANLPDYSPNKSLALGPVDEVGSKSLPVKEPGMENTSTKKSLSHSGSLDAVISSGCMELEEISKLHEKETVEPDLDWLGTSIDANKSNLATKDSLGMLLGSGGTSVAVIQKNPSFGEEAKIHPCVETEHGRASSPTSIPVADFEQNHIATLSSQPAREPLAANDQLIKHAGSSDASDSTPLSGSEHAESDLVEHDVKVCDICGDAGREEKLAVCSRCNDGAEHTYCMRVMLDKVPDGEWLCEGCQSKENAERQKYDNSENPLPASKVLCTTEKNKFSKDISILDCPSKLDSKLTDLEASKASEFVSAPPILAKRQMDGSEVIPAAKKQAAEAISNGTPCLSSIGRKALFLRGGSFKNLDTSKVKPAHPSPLSGGQSSNNSEDIYFLSTPASSNSKMQSRLQSPRNKSTSLSSTPDRFFHVSDIGKASASTSSGLASKAAALSKGSDGLAKLGSLPGMKPKPKVKQILEEASKKQVLARDSACGDNRKEGSVRMISKSASFKSNISTNNLNADDLRLKSQSQNLLSAKDSKGLKQFMEGSNLIGWQNDFKLDPSTNSSTPAASMGNFSVLKSDTLAPECDAKTRISGDITPAPRKDIGKNTAYGNGSRKRPSSFHAENVSPASNQLDKRTGQLEDKSKTIKGIVVDTLLQAAGNGDRRKLSAGFETAVEGPQPQIQAWSSLDNTLSVSNPAEHKVTEQSLTQAGSKEDSPVSSIVPDKSCSNPHHMSQSREYNNLEGRFRELSPFGRSRSFSITGRKIRCFKCNEIGHIAQFCPYRGNDAGVSSHASISTSTIRNSRELTSKNKWIDTLENVLSQKASNHENGRLTILSNDASQPTIDQNNELAPKSLTSIAGVATNCNLITNTACGGASSAGKAVDVQGSISRSATDDGSKPDPCLRGRSFLPSTSPSISSAIPEHDFTWQGGFEVRRSGKLSDICDGIQAHLSSCASPKVLEAAKKFPSKVQLEEISRLSSWPVQFQAKCPTEDNIALYFFAKDVQSYERNYKKLLNNMLRNDLALKANFDGVELLIFTSNQLPDKSQRWNRLLFLWGVFRERKVGCADAVTGSTRKVTTVGTDVESCQEFSSTMVAETSESILPPCVQVVKHLPSLEKKLGAFQTAKAGASKALSAVTPQQSDYRNGSIQGDKLSGSDEPNQSVPDAVESLVEQSPDVALGIKPLTCGGERHNCMGNNDTLEEVHIDSGNRKGMEPPCTQPSGAQNTNSSNCTLPQEVPGDFSNDVKLIVCNLDHEKSAKWSVGLKGNSESAEERDEKKNVQMLIDFSRTNQELVPIKEETVVAVLGSSCKRPHSHSSQKTSLVVDERKDESSNCTSANGERDYKRMKTYNILNAGDHGVCRASQICDLNSSFSDYQATNLDCFHDDRQIPEPSGSTERNFFSVDFGHARDCKASTSNACPSFSSNRDDSGPDIPDLELALGAGTRTPKKGLLPLFIQIDKGSENNHSEARDNFDDANDDDTVSSLSLSLAFPVPVKERPQKPGSTSEKLLPKRPHVSTSLLLFGGCTDS